MQIRRLPMTPRREASNRSFLPPKRGGARVGIFLSAAAALLGAAAWAAPVLAAASPPPARPAAPLPEDDGPRCDLGTPLNPASFDTATGEVLLALPGRGTGAYLVAWKPGATSARILREPAAGAWFGGSTGPGAPFVFARCGTGCLQPIGLRDGAWAALGEPIAMPSAATVQGSYDRSGRPWVVVHGPAERPGFVTAWAFRLEGREWRSRGHLEVTAAGTPAALPAPWLEDAVVSGTGLFSAGAAPRTWVGGLPAGGHEPGSQVVPLSEREIAFLSADGVVFRSGDGGTSWSQASWRPWSTGTAEPWVRGRDFTVDRPLAGSQGLLPLVWFDRRLADREDLLLTEMSGAGRWRQVGAGAGRVPTSAGEDLDVSAVLRDGQGRWTVLFGCVTSGAKASLVLSQLTDGELGAPRLVPLVPASP